MRLPNPELERLIREKTLGLLLGKEPEEIGMREIAQVCGVSATTIYYYYADKETLFEAVKLDCLDEMDNCIKGRAPREGSSLGRLRAGINAFRDWSFENPRIALLVMGRFKPNLNAKGADLARYYRSNDFAKEMIDSAVADGSLRCADTALASALCIAAVWGAIESILLKRSDPSYWERGIFFTDAMIGQCLAALETGGM